MKKEEKILKTDYTLNNRNISAVEVMFCTGEILNNPPILPEIHNLIYPAFLGLTSSRNDLKNDMRIWQVTALKIRITPPPNPKKKSLQAGMFLLFSTEIKPEKQFLSRLKRLHNFKERI